MNVKTIVEDGFRRVAIEEQTALDPPNWESVEGLHYGDECLIVLDLLSVEFASSLFLASCVRLRRELGHAGRELVLMNPPRHFEHLRGLVDGAGQLPVIENDEELRCRLTEAKAARSGEHVGVSHIEKGMLWG